MPRQRFFAPVITIAAVSAPPVGLAQAAGEDPWFGRDKALHFAASASIAAASYGLAAPFTEAPAKRAAVGASVAIAAGIAKEAWDASGSGDASWRDFTWDLVGTATGVLFAAVIDWMIGRAGAARPSGLSP